MTQKTAKDVQQLQREVEKLQRALQREEQQLKAFGAGLGEVNDGLLALVDKNFDGNVYRNALEHSFKEHVYTKIRNLFGAIALIVTIGGGFLVINFIDSRVSESIDSALERRHEDFVEAGIGLKRARLVFLLREIRDADTRRPEDRTPGHDQELQSRVKEIRDQEGFVSDLKELIEQDGPYQALAIHYAGLARETRLEDSIFKVLKEGDAESRVQALNALLRFQKVDIAQKIKDVMEKEDVDESPLWIYWTRIHSVRPVHKSNDKEKDIADSLMRRALKSTRPAVFRAAVLFYMVNPELPKPQFTKDVGNFKVGGKTKQDYFDYLLSKGEDAKPKEERDPYKFLKDITPPNPDPYAREQVRLMRSYVALDRLLSGDNDAKQNVRADEEGYYYYPAEIWEKIKSKFPDFRELSAAGGVGYDERIQTIPGDLRQKQDQLWAQLDFYNWDKEERSYTDSQRPSIAALRKGDTTGLKELISVTYYDDNKWREVLELFPDFRKRHEQDVYEQQMQDVLLQEILFYAWDKDKKEYVYQDDWQEPSIDDLKRGNKEGLEEIISVTYYDDDKWREVLELFPDFRDQYGQDVYEQEMQDVLLEEILFYAWDPEQEIYVYQDPQESSIAALRQGDTAGLEELISVTYYDDAKWLEVLELFPDFRDRHGQDVGKLEMQDVLLGEIEFYSWDDAQQVFVDSR